jgi:DtxR family Mn-dependent transcriptional regulator
VRKSLTEASEDYLKAIYMLEQREDRVSTKLVAERLGVQPASATAMLKKLAGTRLLKHEPYRGVQLTDAGRKVALEVIRHHRLIETYLSEALGVPWDKVHDEAERWEHVLSEEMEDRIDAFLGHPTHDPHGAPIPTRTGVVPPRAQISLAEVSVGETVEVAEVSDDDPELLRYLTSLELGLGTQLKVVGVEPFDGPLTLRLGDRKLPIGRAVAKRIRVRSATEDE